jgi:hypothetical protein
VQYAKRNCAFELIKAHCAATINAKNGSFHIQKFKAQRMQPQQYILNNHQLCKFLCHKTRSRVHRLQGAGLNHYAIRANLTKFDHTKTSDKSCDEKLRLKF